MHLGLQHAFAFDKQLVGGGDGSGNIYNMTTDAYDNAGSVIKRIRRAPHVVDELKWIFYKKFRLSAMVGDGPVGDPNNVIVLRTSNDGGNTWSQDYQKTLGDAGNYTTIIEWRALGRSMRRSFEISTTVRAQVTLVDAFIEVSEGSR
jgi:hypothetical protein